MYEIFAAGREATINQSINHDFPLLIIMEYNSVSMCASLFIYFFNSITF